MKLGQKPARNAGQRAEGRGRKKALSDSALIPHPSALSTVLAFGAHPDDIEFGCGGVVAKETSLGRKVHFVVCSRGESATHGRPEERTVEAENAANLLGATIEFVDLGGDAHFEVRVEHAITLARIIRRAKPGIVLAPTPVENQHPDHARLGALVRDASRLARYGGLTELRDTPPHAIDTLLFYAVTPEAEPRNSTPILIDVSQKEVLAMWKRAMEAHASQTGSREYVELQLTRARLLGLHAGIGHAIALFPNDPPVVDSLTDVCRGTRRF
jgi:N-acetylglucosamine malate deacetylase 1